MGELAKAGDTVLLVTPIDTGAPKGRLILPQYKPFVSCSMPAPNALSSRKIELPKRLTSFKQPPQLVVTDSQVVFTCCKGSSRTYSRYNFFYPNGLFKK